VIPPVFTAVAGGHRKSQKTAAGPDRGDKWSAGKCGSAAGRDAGPEPRDKHPECRDAASPDPDSAQAEVSTMPESKEWFTVLPVNVKHADRLEAHLKMLFTVFWVLFLFCIFLYSF